MATVVGPLEYVQLADGRQAPFYVIKFDKRGVCTTPRSRDHLIATLTTDQPAAQGITDVFLFSHGWNNTPSDAIAAYRRWIAGYRRTLDAGRHRLDRTYRPAIVGVVWPSVWVVPLWERGPRIAAGTTGDDLEDAMVRELAEYVDPEQRERFYALAESEQVSEEEAREFLELLRPLYAHGDDDVDEDAGPSTDALLAGWTALARQSGSLAFVPDDPQAPATVGGARSADPRVAGTVGRLPLDGVRMLSVWQMKDRAGAVGANGVATLLRAILSSEGHRTHLIGHSFGAKVLLSALCSPTAPQLPRPVDSLLLLQPAINQYALADDVPDRGTPGGYHGALERVLQPIVATFTRNDAPLRTFFHIALQRSDDLGEIRIASDEPPSRYAAMGGYGPQAVSSHRVLDVHEAGRGYELGDSRPEVIGLRAHDRITGHGDIDNPFTHWALYSLVRGL